MRRWATQALSGVICLGLLSACSGLQDTRRGENLSGLLRAFVAAKQKGEVGSVEGHVFLTMPGVPTPLNNWPVMLVPLSPALETAIATTRDRFERSGRAPLSAEDLGRARRLIDAYVKEVITLGHPELVKTTNTGEKEPKFTFADVPEGQWILTAELPSKISILLWAVPVTVTKGDATKQSLNDGNIWLEGLTP